MQFWRSLFLVFIVQLFKHLAIMSNNLDRFGKDASWLQEHGFKMVPRGWAESLADEDYYSWTVFKKFDKLEVRLQQDAYNEDNWKGWPVFDGPLNDFIDHKAFTVENCESAEDAFKEVILKIKEFADAILEKQAMLQNCGVDR